MARLPSTARSPVATLLAALTLLLAVPPAASQAAQCEEDAMVCVRKIVEHSGDRGWLGVELDRGGGEMVLKRVVPESPAARAGLLAGDRLESMNGIPFGEEHEEEIRREFEAFAPGKEISFVVEREGEQLEVEAVLVPIPDAILAQWVGQHMLKHLEGEAE